MPQFRLLEPHYINDQFLEAGTLVGDDTPYPFKGKPSRAMEGTDDESQKAVDEARGRGTDPETSLRLNRNDDPDKYPSSTPKAIEPTQPGETDTQMRSEPRAGGPTRVAPTGGASPSPTPPVPAEGDDTGAGSAEAPTGPAESPNRAPPQPNRLGPAARPAPRR